MDKTAIKNFAIEARKILMKSAITEAGFYGITKDGCQPPVQKGNDFEVYETVAGTENRIFGDDIKRRANLVTAIKEQGFDQVIEETAYTWFNRIIAIRFMEVNNYLPTRVRVLSSETGSTTPDIVTQSDTVELNLSSEELERIQAAKRENRYDDAFRSLFIKQCNELNAILPGLFEKTDDYMELLLKITYTGDGVIRMLVDSIPEDNFNVETEGQVEIIGWMYQYYNTELKDDTFAKLKKNVKITKERIPAATQLFTPDWIVRYMVENSLGRVWIEHLRAVDPSVDEKAKAEEFGWKYYLPEAEQEDDVQAQLIEIRKSYKDLTPQDITCIDPCMGSGHILVYMFDVLMDIYRSEGFSEREAVFDVLEKNIRGLDIDRRAYQLSYFALMMKARGYNRIFFRGHDDIDGNRVQASPKVYAIEESNSIDRSVLQYYGAGLDELRKNNAINQLNGLLDALTDAKEYGSLLSIDSYDWDLLRSFVKKIDDNGQVNFISYAASQSQSGLKKLLEIGEVLSAKYYSVVTNPPYMGAGGMGTKLSDYAKKYFNDTRTDLFAMFIERCLLFSCRNAFFAMITQQSWMFTSSYEQFREKMREKTIVNMIHLGAHAFDEIGGEVVQTTSFVYRNYENKSYRGCFIRDVSAVGEEAKNEEALLSINNHNDNYYINSIGELDKITGKPLSYWASPKMLVAFEKAKRLADLCETRKGLATSDNNRFLRLWFEVDRNNLSIDCSSNEETMNRTTKWYPINKGGEYRRWYGNREYIINWMNDGYEIRNFRDDKGKLLSRPQNTQYNFKTALTWSKITSSDFSARFCEGGFLFDDASAICYHENQDYLLYIVSFLNSPVCQKAVGILNPTLNIQIGDIGNLPIIEKEMDGLLEIVRDNIALMKEDWDSYEMSWDFEMHPLVRQAQRLKSGDERNEFVSLEECFNSWSQECERRRTTLKSNEERLNKFFIDAYNLGDELTPEVENKNISAREADKERDIKSLISYAVGCMFGRYSIEKSGLIYAGGKIDFSQYIRYSVDDDAIIPITDEPYFEDDIVGRFVEFVKIVFGSESLEKNLEYIAGILGTKGNSSREIIRNYFLNDFYKDHCNIYSVTGSGKRPIYWQFDSGKQNGFKCLIYLHRYTPDTVGMIRSDYLTKTQSMIENALKNAEYAINTSSSAVDRAQATKKRDKYIKQLTEIRAYYPALSHIALQRIELDLDDGVKANYAKFQGIEVSVEGEKKQKVDLLAKI